MSGIAVCTLIVLVPIAIVVWINVSSARHWRRVATEKNEIIDKLTAADRYIPWSELRPKLEAGKGTLIHEILDIKGVHLEWWTEDDIIALSPTELASPSGYREPCDKSRAFAAQCVRDYTDLQSGTAMVTRFDEDVMDLRVTSCYVGATPSVVLFQFGEEAYLQRGTLSPSTPPQPSDEPKRKRRLGS